MRTGLMVLAVTATVATGAAAQTTVQQDYDAATALDDKGDRADALAAWQRLEKRPNLSKRTRAIVQVREGAALVALGRLEEAAQATRAGLVDLPANDPTLVEDRWQAYQNLGLLAQDALDYASAADSFAKAEAIAPDPVTRIGTLVSLTRTATFVDPAIAHAALGRLDAAVAGTRLSRPDQAAVANARTVALLNAGDFKDAQASAKTAVNALGGLTVETRIDDVRARSNAAIALLLSGSVDEARRYMAMTGAGRLTKGEFDPGVAMRVPDCGGEADLKPDDMAVVEFSIDPNGRTVAVAPIYAAGGGPVGLEFARAVRDWSWTPEQLARTPAFFRTAVRVEMRCSTAFDRPGINDIVGRHLVSWLGDKGVTVADEPQGAFAAAMVEQRAALAKAEAQSPTSLQTLAALYRLASNPVVPVDERRAMYPRALAIATSNSAPPVARLAIDIPLRTSQNIDGRKASVFVRLIAPMLSEQPYAGDAEARAAIRLMLADRQASSDRLFDKDGPSLALLEQVADDKALPPANAFRVGAMIRIASIEQRNGNLPAARASFAASGLSADQCALMDAQPRLATHPGSEAFPQEAQAWGFEGWTLTQFDVAANGDTDHVRALLSYPPFVFTKAATQFFDRARYATTYRPDGGLRCGATTNRVSFRLPGS